MTVIKNDQGVDIDDRTVDKHSGWEIERIMMSSEEGYASTGFKLQTREIIEKDAGSAVFQSPSEQKQLKSELLANPKGKIINNVITSVSNYMGIVLETLREEIIKHTLLALEATVDSQDE